MSDKSNAFDFSQFVPGFDFLKNLTSPAASGGGEYQRVRVATI